MRSIIKWVIFVPVCMLTSLLTLFVNTNSAGTFLGFTQNSAAQLVMYAVLGLVVLFFIISLFDRKTSPVHLLKKNIFCGIAAILSAFLFAADAALGVTEMTKAASFEAMDIIICLFTLLMAVALLFVGLNHFTATNTPKNISILYLSLPLWCAVHLIARFLEHTAMPVAPADTLDLVLFVTMALFSIYAMMIHALIPSKNAVKSAVSMGLPTVVISFAFCISQVSQLVIAGKTSFIDLLPAVSYGVLGLYVLGFTAELSFTAKSKEEQIILFDEEDKENVFEEAENTEEESQLKDEKPLPVIDQNPSELKEDSADEEPAVLVPRSVDDEDDVADELFRAAKESDSKSKNNDIDLRSEDEMIIEGEINEVKAQKKPLETASEGTTVREAVAFDDDFIISLGDVTDESFATPAKTQVSVSEPEIKVEKETLKTDSETENYTSRLDEIDKLINSIQGGDIEETKESLDNNE